MRTLLLVFAMLTSIVAFAYEPMIREDRIWEYEYAYWDGGIPPGIYINHHIIYFKFEGTKDVNGVRYNILKMKISDVITPGTDEKFTEIALMRESGNKVYMILEQDEIGIDNFDFSNEKFTVKPGTEVVLYDFTTDDAYGMDCKANRYISAIGGGNCRSRS